MAQTKHESITLGIFDGKPLAVSGFGGGSEVEILKEKWETEEPLPFSTTGIFYFSTVTINNDLMIFGETTLTA